MSRDKPIHSISDLDEWNETAPHLPSEYGSGEWDGRTFTDDELWIIREAISHYQKLDNSDDVRALADKLGL